MGEDGVFVLSDQAPVPARQGSILGAGAEHGAVEDAVCAGWASPSEDGVERQESGH